MSFLKVDLGNLRRKVKIPAFFNKKNLATERSKKEATNFLRVTTALRIGGNILRNELKIHFDPKDLPSAIKIIPGVKKFQREQEQAILSAKEHEYKGFDIPLLYILLRHQCPNLEPPEFKWPDPGKPFPAENEREVAHHVDRINRLRNKICHSEDQVLSDATFNLYWNQLEIVCTCMERRHIGAEYLNQLNTIKTECIDAEAEVKINRFKRELGVIRGGLTGCIVAYFWYNSESDNSKPYFTDCKNERRNCFHLKDDEETFPINWTLPIALDKEDGELEVKAVEGKGPGISFLPVGTHTVRYKAVDSKGEIAECSETIHILRSSQFEKYCEVNGTEAYVREDPISDAMFFANEDRGKTKSPKSDKENENKTRKENNENDTEKHSNIFDKESDGGEQNDMHNEDGGDDGDGGDDQGGDNDADPGNGRYRDDSNDHDRADGDDNHGESDNQHRDQQGNWNTNDNRGSGFGHGGHSQNFQQNYMNGDRYQQYHVNGNRGAGVGQGMNGNDQPNGPSFSGREGQSNSFDSMNGNQNVPNNETPGGFEDNTATNSTDASNVDSVKVDTTKLFPRGNYEGKKCEFCDYKIPKGSKLNGFADRYPFHVECMPRLLGG